MYANNDCCNILVSWTITIQYNNLEEKMNGSHEFSFTATAHYVCTLHVSLSIPSVIYFLQTTKSDRKFYYFHENKGKICTFEIAFESLLPEKKCMAKPIQFD